IRPSSASPPRGLSRKRKPHRSRQRLERVANNLEKAGRQSASSHFYDDTTMNHTPRQRSCYKCGFYGEAATAECPTCHAKTQTAVANRIRGVLLIFCGVILVGMMSYITLWAWTAVNATTTTGARFTGTAAQERGMFGLFAAIILFGAISFIVGAFQLISGRRNKWLVRVSMVAAIVVAAGAGSVAVL